MFLPFQILALWLRGLLSLALLSAGLFLLAAWYDQRETVIVHAETTVTAAPGQPPQRTVERRPVVVPWQFGWNVPTADLLGGLALLAWSLGGGLLLRSWHGRAPAAGDPGPRPVGTVHRLRQPDGRELYVEAHGPPHAPPLVLIHGWGLDGDEWTYAKRELAGRYRLLVWDLPGLGRAPRPQDRDWSLDRLAADLDAIIGLAGGEPVILVGHSIGGMIVLNYCKRFPQALGSKVRGLVLGHTTYTNPARTCAWAGLYTALQKPLLEPLCLLMVWLAPLVRLMNWLSYLNGSAHRSTHRGSFSGQETRGQLEFLTRKQCAAPPDVIGRGMLAMFRYDASDALASIPVPALVVAGSDDEWCLPSASQHVATTIPGGRLCTLRLARHSGLFEFHEPFAAVVAEFAVAGDSVPDLRITPHPEGTAVGRKG